MVLWHSLVLSNIALPKANMPLKIGHHKRKLILQLLIFRGEYVCYSEGIVDPLCCQPHVSDIQDMESIASAYTTAIHCAFWRDSHKVMRSLLMKWLPRFFCVLVF